MPLSKPPEKLYSVNQIKGLFLPRLSKEDAAKAGAVIGAAVAGHYAEEMVVFSDGSTMQNLAPAG